MPTYDYVCHVCGYTFEQFQSIKAEPLKICPQCNGQISRKIGGGVGLLFKGNGFYITDYKKSGQPEKKKDKTDSTTKKETKKESAS